MNKIEKVKGILSEVYGNKERIVYVDDELHSKVAKAICNLDSEEEAIRADERKRIL